MGLMGTSGRPPLRQAHKPPRGGYTAVRTGFVFLVQLEARVSTTAIIVVVVVVAVLLLVGLSFLMLRHRGQRRALQEQFGPEYDRMVAATGNPKTAEAELHDRLDQRQQFELRPLSWAERDRYFQ